MMQSYLIISITHLESSFKPDDNLYDCDATNNSLLITNKTINITHHSTRLRSYLINKHLNKVKHNTSLSERNIIITIMHNMI
jgi:hypothetical protein